MIYLPFLINQTAYGTKADIRLSCVIMCCCAVLHTEQEVA